MIRAMYTAASGMNAQQANIDNIAHNLANVNTSGFKKSRVEFEDLVYEQITSAGTPTDATAETPVGVELGLGTKMVAVSRDFASGNLRATNAPYDVAIEGKGFLQVTLPDGQTAYTRSGNLHVNQEGTLVTNDGYVLEPSITIPSNAVSVTIGRDGVVSATVAGESAPQQIGNIQLAGFQNPAGLHALGSNLFAVTTASGDAVTGLPGTEGLGTLQQGFLEESNVSIVEEMVNMILGQRAYEANSKVIRTADEMLGQVNNIAR
ncbi:MAG TPA: flagellar basal-body rod protein FlgG [Luteitalea sp.]|nr:flagellar basal-body rod protein FlgG [Luteitalea sp.]